MTFCLMCSKKMTLRVPDMDNRARLICESCGYIHYENPKLIVGILPFINNQILLCKRAIDPCYGKWTIPAGFLENNESLLDGAKREAREEAGITVFNPKLYASFSIPRISQIYMIYLAELTTKDLDIGPETIEANFYKINDIPWNEIAFTSIKILLKHYKNDIESNKFPFRDITLE